MTNVVRNERSFLLVVNPFSGKTKKNRGLIAEVKNHLESKGYRHAVIETKPFIEGQKEPLVAQSDSWTDAIVIGGDGTINLAVNGLMNRPDIAFSFIAAGTGNDFIKSIHIGHTTYDQLNTCLYGETTEIDVGDCNGRAFLNGVGIGFDGKVVQNMLSIGTKHFGNAAYYYHVLKILATYKENRIGYDHVSEYVEKEIFSLTIANGTTFGGSFVLTPNAKVDDGLLEVCEIGRVSVLQRFAHINTLFTGKHGGLRFVKHFATQQLHIHPSPDVFAHIDGEYLGSPPFSIKVNPSAIKIRQRKE